jgi:hypothetical protein
MSLRVEFEQHLLRDVLKGRVVKEAEGGVFLRRLNASSVIISRIGPFLTSYPSGLSRAFLTTLFISSCIRGLMMKSQAPALIASTAVTRDA